MYLTLIVGCVFVAPFVTGINHECDDRCGSFCDCIDQIAPKTLVTIEKLEKTHRKCGEGFTFGESKEFWEDFGDEAYEQSYRDLAGCLMPACTGCMNKLEKLMGLRHEDVIAVGAARRARSVFLRRKRSTDALKRSKRQVVVTDSESGSVEGDLKWNSLIDQYDKCVAAELGMKLDQYRLYEAQLEVAEGGITTCYLFGCKKTFPEFVSTLKDCKVNKTIDENVLDFMG